jgi:tRNA(Ile)-lysidine synthase
MDPLAQRVEAAVRTQRLLHAGGRVLVGLSGGPDSVALALVLREIGAEGRLPQAVALAHLNHGLRGAEADGDEEFCRGLAERWGLPFFARRLPPGLLARGGGSFEAAARRARLSFLAEVARREGIGTVALGHQADDAAETVLLRLLRGCGLRGLAALRARRPLGHEAPGVQIVRPLLSVRKEELLAYLARRGQSWRLDGSNADVRLERNRIRRVLLPALAEHSGTDCIALLAAANDAAVAVRDALDEAVDRLWAGLCRREGSDGVELDAPALRGLPAALRKAVLYRAAALLAGGCDRPPALTRPQQNELAGLVERPVGRALTLAGGVMARHEHGLLRLSRRGPRPPQVAEAVPLPVPGCVELPGAGLAIEARLVPVPPEGVGALLAEAGPGRVFLSPAAAGGGLLHVRFRRPGDRFRPLGAPGSRKLKRFLIDRKVPAHRRDLTPLVIAADGTLAWVVGVEVCERFRLTGAEDSAVLLTAGKLGTVPNGATANEVLSAECWVLSDSISRPPRPPCPPRGAGC